MLEALLKRDRSVILAGLIVVILLSWVYLFYLARDMTGMDMSVVNDAGIAKSNSAGAPKSSDSSASMNNMDMSKSNRLDMSKSTATATTSKASTTTNSGVGAA